MFGKVIDINSVRFAISKRQMRSLMVVKPNSLLNSLCGLGKRDKPKFETVFEFKNTVDTFG